MQLDLKKRILIVLATGIFVILFLFVLPLFLLSSDQFNYYYLPIFMIVVALVGTFFVRSKR